MPTPPKATTTTTPAKANAPVTRVKQTPGSIAQRAYDKARKEWADLELRLTQHDAKKATLEQAVKDHDTQREALARKVEWAEDATKVARRHPDMPAQLDEPSPEATNADVEPDATSDKPA